jgi:demethylmenaquinone methyltransferase / 2-methoxy-6-polyprenyl-1,4-benzoquinol methylase
MTSVMIAKKSTAKTPRRPSGQEGNWFGFKPISPRAKQDRVKQVFESVAPSYDLMNDLMSLGIHRIWKRRFAALVAPRTGEVVLDVAGGTGDIAFLLRKAAPKAKITVCDINPAMLAVGQDRARNRGILKGLEFLEGNAEKLPVKSKSVDVYTIAFGLRNVTDIDAALRDAHRVLKPGGRFFCLEFSQVAAPLQPFYDLYSFALLPALGRVIANDEESYRYLAESIRQFPPQAELAERMKKAGFKGVSFSNFSGGIVAVHSGRKA